MAACDANENVPLAVVEVLRALGHHLSGRIEAQADFLLRTLEETPDWTRAELQPILRAERGEPFALSTIHDCLQRHEITLKKPRAPAREPEREDLAAQCQVWVAEPG